MKTYLLSSVFCLMSVCAAAQDNQQHVAQPLGLYHMKEVVRMDGQHIAPTFDQYKYCTPKVTLQAWHSFSGFAVKSCSFSFRQVDPVPLRFTGELSATENLGAQIFGIDSASFTLRWYSEMQHNDMFPYQQNVDERYTLVSDSSNKVRIGFDLLSGRLGDKQHELKGVWRRRGHQHRNIATSQYWVDAMPQETYAILGSDHYMIVEVPQQFPVWQTNVKVDVCNYLSYDAVALGTDVCTVHWFDRNTISTTLPNPQGQPIVIVWDRCGLPSVMQEVFGTQIPICDKDLTPYCTQSFFQKYGQKPDSVLSAFEDYHYLTQMNEENNAIFPMLMESGFKEEYEEMKGRLMEQLLAGEIGIDEATGRYIGWFNRYFDRHTFCNSRTFYQLAQEYRIDYKQLIKEYNPKPIACKVDKKTYLVRIPSCSGNYPTWEWVREKVAEFKASGCENLILDVRGNGGGNDGLGFPFYQMLGDSKLKYPEEIYFRSGFYTISNIRDDKLRYNNSFDRIDRVYNNAINHPDSTYLFWFNMPDSIFAAGVKHGAVIMDEVTASAGESYVRFVKNYSRKVAKVYGKENSSGCDATGNVLVFYLPHSRLEIGYPTTVDKTFRETCKSRKPGLKPDVIIPLPYPVRLTDNIDEWVRWVAKKL